MRTFIRRVEEAIAAGEPAAAAEALRLAQPEIMSNVSRGVVHKRTASRTARHAGLAGPKGLELPGTKGPGLRVSRRNLASPTPSAISANPNTAPNSATIT